MIWKDIKNYEGTYQASDEGFIRRICKDGRTKLLKNRPSANYYTVCLSKNGVKKTHAVHRLIAETFLDRKEGQTEVNHIDGNKLNNRVENLEWVTQQDNIFHAIEINRCPFGKPARKVKCIDPVTEEVVAIFKSVTDASKSVGKMSARASITHVCQGFQQTAYGYKWEYVE